VSEAAARRPATRDRIITASSELMRRNGYAGTGVKAILTASEAPYGSLYHHFPGGKEEVGVETLRAGGRAYLALVESYFTTGVDLVAATSSFFDDAASFVASTDFIDACPIATIAGEIATTSEPMRAAAAEAFTSWLGFLEASFCEAGMEHPAARALAVELFCLIEGAFLLSRTTRDVEPIRTAGRAAARAVRDAIGVREAVVGRSR
jgi:TetR/AcrR family transcriptional regulator, lmrAB and yxaGH operons repressor